jgi:cytoskeleton-associated protein 5
LSESEPNDSERGNSEAEKISFFLGFKVWKARVSAYEDLTKLYRQATSETSGEFSKYLGYFKKIVIDSNAVAQEKGLEATLAFLENASPSISGR